MKTECALCKSVSRDENCVLLPLLLFEELSDLAVHVELPTDCVLFDLGDSSRLGYLDIPIMLSDPRDDPDDEDDDDDADDAEVRSEWKQEKRLKQFFGAPRFFVSSYL